MWPHAVLLPVMTHVPLYSFLTLISSSWGAVILLLNDGSRFVGEDDSDRAPGGLTRGRLLEEPVDDDFGVWEAVGRVELLAWVGMGRNLKFAFHFRGTGKGAA